MGQFLKTELSSDQLEFRLADGTASLQRVSLNTEYINEIVEPFGVVSVNEGYIHEISTYVPWKKLMTDSTIIKIKGLDLTLAPLSDVHALNASELVSSMIESMVSSMDLTGFIEDTNIASEVANAGVDRFAGLIDRVISRIKLIFEDVVLRVDTHATTPLCTGIEIQIDRMEFMDEQMESGIAGAANGEESTNTANSNGAAATITTQPSSVYAATDLHKLLRVQGVRVYTDIFSPLNRTQQNLRSPIADDGDDANFRSCYSTFNSRSIIGGENLNASCINSTTAAELPSNAVLVAQFFSEEHTVRIRVGNPIAVNSTTSSSSNSKNTSSNLVGAVSHVATPQPSTPPATTSASAGGGLDAANKQVQVEINVGGALFFYAAPSQLVLLKDLFSRLIPRQRTSASGVSMNIKTMPSMGEMSHVELLTAGVYGGRQMRPEHFQQITNQFHGASDLAGFSTTATSSAEVTYQQQNYSQQHPSCHYYQAQTQLQHGGGWGGQEQFYEVMSSSESTHKDGGESMLSVPTTSAQSAASGDEKHSDGVTIRIKCPILVFIVTHDDPLDAERISARIGTARVNQAAQFGVIGAAIADMAAEAQRFFDAVIGVNLEADGLRDALAALCPRDHLRMVSNGATLKLVLSNDCAQNSVEFTGSLEECDVCECLMPVSIVGRKSNEPAHFDLLNFSNNRRKAVNEVLTFKLVNSKERANIFFVDLHMENCKTEVDVSIVDRISRLLAPNPCFAPYIRSLNVVGDGGGAISSKTNNRLMESVAGGSGCAVDDEPPVLRDLLASDSSFNDEPTRYHIRIHVSRWSINLRIPIADLSDESEAYWKRNVHPEYLKLILDDALLDAPTFLPTDLAMCGSVALECRAMTGIFAGILKQLECTREETRFFYADSNIGNNNELDGRRLVKLKIDYDTRDKSLKLASGSLTAAAAAAAATRGVDADGLTTFQRRNSDYADGPFSRFVEYIDDEIKLSSLRENERVEFVESRRELTNVNVRLNAALLNISLPSQKFFEILYNRFGNDFALWQPRSPAFSTPNSNSVNTRTFNNATGLSTTPTALDAFALQFQECQAYDTSFGKEESYDSYCVEAMSSRGEEDISPAAPSLNTSPLNASSALPRVFESHLFSLLFQVKKASVVLKTKVKNETTKEEDAFFSQLGAEMNDAEFFVVYGVNSNANITHLYVTSAAGELFHQNLLDGVKGFPCNVVDVREFAAHQPSDVLVEPAGAGEPFTRFEENNFNVGLKLELLPDSTDKNAVLVIGLRNTLAHARPVICAEHFWVRQFADFFNVVDYAVPGYRPPVVNVNLHINLRSVLLGYDHVNVVPNSQMRLRLEIGQSHLRSRIVHDMDCFKFDCEFQESNLWMCKIRSSSKASSQRHGGDPFTHLQMPTFVRVLYFGFLKFAFRCPYEASTTTSVSRNAQTKPQPAASSSAQPQSSQYQQKKEEQQAAVDFYCDNDLVKIWVCSDTIIELLNIVIEFMNSEVGVFLMAKKVVDMDAAQKQLDEFLRNAENSLDREQQVHIGELMAEAIQDFSTTSKTTSTIASHSVNSSTETTSAPATTPRRKTSNTSSMAARLSAAARSPIIEASPSEASSFSSANSTDDEFIMIQKKRNTSLHNDSDYEFVMSMPDDAGDVQFSAGSNQGALRATASGTTNSGPVPIIRHCIGNLSLHVFLYGGNDFGESFGAHKTYSKWGVSDAGDQSREVLTIGGRFRDQTVCVQAKINDISFLHEVFDGEQPKLLSRYRLKISSVEVLDHVLVSDIDHMLYQHRDSNQPRCTAPMFLVNIEEDMSNEATMNVSIMPIRMNFDQDTVEFLQDFFGNISQGLRNGISAPPPVNRRNEEPLMELPPRVRRQCSSTSTLSAASSYTTMPASQAPTIGTPGSANAGLLRDLIDFGAGTDDAETTSVSSAERLGSAVRYTAANSSSSAADADGNGEAISFITSPPRKKSRESNVSLHESTLVEHPNQQQLFSTQQQQQDLAYLFSEEDVQLEETQSLGGGEALRGDGQHLSDSSINSTTVHGFVADNRKSSVESMDIGRTMSVNPDGGLRTLSRLSGDIKSSSSTASLMGNNTLTELPPPPEPLRPETLLIDHLFDENSRNNVDSARSRAASAAAAAAAISSPTDTFFREFTFYPPCRIRLDYVGKRVKTDQGALIGFLIGMMDLRRTEITLKELHNERGMRGIRKCIQYVLDEWLADIRSRQLAGVLSSYGPISSLVELTQGIRDLFALPLGEMQKKDGRLVNGLQLGASRFGLNTTSAAIGASQHLAALIQAVAEFAFDLVTPDYTYQRRRQNAAIAAQNARVAGDMREGITMAYDAMRDGMYETTRTFSEAMKEERACGGSVWGLRGILRHATPAALFPVVAASRATVHMLNGIKNQLKPDEYREDKRKWRQAIQRAGVQRLPVELPPQLRQQAHMRSDGLATPGQNDRIY